MPATASTPFSAKAPDTTPAASSDCPVTIGSMMAKVCSSTPISAVFGTACSRKAWNSTSPTNPTIR